MNDPNESVRNIQEGLTQLGLGLGQLMVPVVGCC